MQDRDGGDRRARSAIAIADVAVSVVAAVFGVGLLAWSWRILAHSWTYNDAGTSTYVVLASIVGVPGIALVIAAAGVLLRHPRH